MAAEEQVIRAPAQLGVLLRGVRRQRGLSQQDLALKAGGPYRDGRIQRATLPDR
jgi:HTH-type transcriptional regulator / antitoxin HipB